MVHDFLLDDSKPLESRHTVYEYYGTFTRSMLTICEVTLANWAKPARILVSNISEGYSAFFLTYRCIVGFGVLGVISAVFIQQTMQTATRDHEIMVRQLTQQQEDYSRKLKDLFKTMDIGSSNKPIPAQLPCSYYV